jgi:hypothetical protein
MLLFFSNIKGLSVNLIILKVRRHDFDGLERVRNRNPDPTCVGGNLGGDCLKGDFRKKASLQNRSTVSIMPDEFWDAILPRDWKVQSGARGSTPRRHEN